MGVKAIRDLSLEEVDRLAESTALKHGEDAGFLKRVLRAMRHLDAQHRITLEAIQSVREPLA